MLDDRLDGWLNDLQEERVDTVEALADRNQIIELLRVDGEFFIEFFLADQLDMSVPEFHTEIWSLLTDAEKDKVLLAIPRDHAKTTLAKLSVIWHWLYTNHRFGVYLSNTNPIAKGACKDIIEFLSHPNYVAVFGPVEMIKSSENESLWIFDITMANGRIKRCILRAIGQGQQMRGINIDNVRPDFAVIDDVEDKDNTKSPYLQAQLDDWMFSTFLKALSRKPKILWLGNMLQKTSLLARLSQKPAWNPVVFGSIVRDTEAGTLVPLWPEKWSLRELQEDFQNFKDLGLVESWMCEMMNMPGHGENGFTMDQINYRPVPNPDEIEAAWISIDPAFGLNANNDETCIAVSILPKEGVPMTAEVFHGRVDEHQMFEQALEMASRWNANVWGIEAVAAQRVLIPMFELLLSTRAHYTEIEIIPLMSGRGDPKVGRMSAWVSLMAAGEWAIPEGEVDITNQILGLDLSKKDQEDDIVDGCSYGSFMLDDLRGLIMSMAVGESLNQPKAKFGMEINSV